MKRAHESGVKRARPSWGDDEGSVLRGYDWAVWCDVMDKLYSTAGDAVLEGVEEVGRWRAGVGVNVAIDATASLAEAKARDWARETARVRGETTALRRQEIATLYSMAIVRMVNGLTSEIEKRTHGKSVRLMASELGLPDELVEVRHAATHAALPSLHELRIATALALDYLLLHYWQPQREAMLSFHRRKAAPGAAAEAERGAPLTHLIHPYLTPAPQPGDSAPAVQHLTRMEAECPDGVEPAIAALEKELGIDAAAARAPVWAVSTRPLADILAEQEAVATVSDVALVAS